MLTVAPEMPERRVLATSFTQCYVSSVPFNLEALLRPTECLLPSVFLMSTGYLADCPSVWVCWGFLPVRFRT